MKRSHVRALSARAGALLGAIAVLVTGCAAAGGGSGPLPDRTGAAKVAARSSGHGAAPRAAGITRTDGARNDSGSRIAWEPPLSQCAYSAGRPLVAVSGSPVAIPRYPSCRWCACAWSCCDCGPGHWSARPYPAWQFCSCWRWPPGWGGSAIPPACRPGCRARVCPARLPLVPGPARAARGSSQDRVPGGITAGAR